MPETIIHEYIRYYGLSPSIQPEQYTEYSHSVFKHGSRVSPFIIVKVSLCYSNRDPWLLDRNALSDCIG